MVMILAPNVDWRVWIRSGAVYMWCVIIFKVETRGEIQSAWHLCRCWSNKKSRELMTGSHSWYHLNTNLRYLNNFITVWIIFRKWEPSGFVFPLAIDWDSNEEPCLSFSCALALMNNYRQRSSCLTSNGHQWINKHLTTKRSPNN